MVKALEKTLRVFVCFTLIIAGLITPRPAKSASGTVLPHNAPSPAPAQAATPPLAPLAQPTFTHSLYLDGIGDYVEVPYTRALNDYTHLTLEAWVRRASDNRCETIISKGQLTDYSLGFCNRAIRLYLNGTAYESNMAIPAEVWTHIAVVWSNNTFPQLPRVKFYINGALDRSIFATAVPTQTTTSLYIGANPDAAGLLAFYGNLAEIRLWGQIRTQDEIRRAMHVTLEEPLPGLIANWHLTDDYADNIGGHDGTLRGGADLNGSQAPPQPNTVPTDENFNTLPAARGNAAAVYVPERNQALLIGGGSTTSIYALNAANGDTTTLTPLPYYLNDAAAAYAPSQDSVYIFGGEKSLTFPQESNEVYVLDPTTGYTRTLPFTLPTRLKESAAVYHPETAEVYLIGGRYHETSIHYTVTQTIQVFNPVSETLITASLQLPQPRYAMAAVHAHATHKIYVFGGQDTYGTPVSTIYALAPDVGTVTTLTVSLPKTNYSFSAVEDPHTGLIYILGGLNASHVLVFDPVTEELWETSIVYEKRYNASAIYSPDNRHALLIGGQNESNTPQNNIWRIPLGDGPAIPLGRWDFPALNLSSNTHISAIDGDEDHVLVGTNTSEVAGTAEGAWRFDADGTALQYTAAALGNGDGRVHDARYDADNHWVWVATNDAGAMLFDSDSTSLVPTTVYTSDILGTDTIISIDVKPDANTLNGAPFIGTYFEGLKWQYYSYIFPIGWRWTTSFAGSDLSALTHRAPGDLWVIASGQLNRLIYTTNGSNTPTFYGDRQCGEGNIGNLAFGPNGDWWLVSSGTDEFSAGGVCHIPAATTPSTDGLLRVPQIPIGRQAQDVDVDRDGRIWVAFADGTSANGESGGLVAWEAADSPRQLVRTEEYTWKNAPVGGNITDTKTVTTLWESGVRAVGAVDERVWAGTDYQSLVTLAQRWQQIDEANSLDQKTIERLWAIRGHLFLASENTLYVLEPDGKQWDTRGGTQAYAVLADSQQRIWVGTHQGVRQYTSTGWDTLPDVVGQPPTSTVYALAEDKTGRIWIGSEQGLTLFDRDRFVTTFTAQNSSLPTDTVKALLSDKENRLWIGTTAGLARMDYDAEREWDIYTTTHGLPNNMIYDLAQLGDGQVAISTDNGLSLYDGNTFQAETLPIDAVNLPLTVDELGRLWAGSAVRTADEWQGYYWTNSGLRHSAISDNAADGADRVWFSHAPENGVSVRGAYLPPLANTVPSIDHITPRYGTAGDEITIVGSGFGNNVSDVAVSIGGAAADIIQVTDDITIVVRLNDNNISGDVSVSVDGRRVTKHDGSAPVFCAIPQIREVSPTGGNAGVTINIRGTNFDYNPQVYIGSRGPHGVVTRRTPTHLEMILQPDDTRGTVRVENTCHNAPSAADDISTVEVRHVTLGLADVRLNQGVESYGLVPRKPTLMQHYVTEDGTRRNSDVLAIDEVAVTFTSNGTSTEYDLPYNRAVPAWTSYVEARQRDIQNTLNVYLSPDIESGESIEVHTALKNRGLVVAESTHTEAFRAEYPIVVLLVPIMQEGYTSADLYGMQALVNSGLDEARLRMPIIGRVTFVWSPRVPTSDENIDLGNVLDLYSMSHRMDRARSRWNNNHNPDALFAFGVVDPRIVTGSVSGYGFWPDISELLNVLLLDWLDALCDIGNALLQFFSFGLLGSDDGCHLEIPLYIGWAVGGPRDGASEASYRDGVSSLFTHEFGHIMGLVKGWAPNHGTLDPLNDDYNISHSKYDELNNGSCGSSDDNDYTVGKTFYHSPAVWDPVVNPLTQQQLYPRLNVTTTWSITSRAYTDRAKAMMSYACARDNDNTFFEPVDLRGIFATFGATSFLDFVSDLIPGGHRAPIAQKNPAADGPTPIPIAGQRLYVSGVITQSTNTGELRQVEVLGEDAPLSAGFATDYWLVQFNGEGDEVFRTGIYPSFSAVASTGASVENDMGFFGATLLAHEDVGRLELHHGDTVLDTFSAGSASPVVTLTRPSGGVYSSGMLTVTWTATDPDGDKLDIVIDYSADDGATWTTMDFSENANGSTAIPVYQLAGSTTGRIRVTASDGFNSGSDTSAVFSVSDQPPRPYIGQPAPGSTFLEGQHIWFFGGADDNQDGSVANASLRWHSDRDGDLGAGSGIGVVLSVGEHTLTLEAENSVGLTASTSVTLTIEGDYDYDGVPDAEEAALKLNPLSETDVYSDTDGDGLPLITEMRYGTTDSQTDSDGDGRDDGEELLAGTDPATTDALPPTDILSVSPDALAFEADLALDTPLPQAPLQIVSDAPAAWTLNADGPWLAASTATGTTPDVTTILVQAYDLTEGVHTGVLTFTSATLTNTVSVPVVVTITNSAGHFDANMDTCVNVGDLQETSNLIPSNNGLPGFDYHYDVDRDGDIDADDTQLLAQRWSETRGTCDITYPMATSIVRVNAPPTIGIGALVTATIWISAPQNLTGFEFDLGFDPTILQAERVLLGDLLGSTGRTTYTLGPILNNVSGTVTLGAYSSGEAESIDTDGLLAQVTLRALALGQSTLDLQTPLLATTSSTLTVATSEDASIEVISVSCWPLSDVEITGPSSGITNTAYVFTATVTPQDADPPITYTWSPEPDAGQNTATATYNWATTGSQTLSVTVSNCGGIASAAAVHTISIQAPPPNVIPVRGLAIAGITEGLINQTYTFTATVTPSNATPVTYTWSPAPEGGQDTALASYTWPTTGTKRLHVTATGFESQATATHTLAITLADSKRYLYLPLVLKD